MNERTGAALAYGLGKTGTESKVIVYDLGGGTFDVSLPLYRERYFLSTDHCRRYSPWGEDFDNRVIDYLVKAYDKKTRTDVSDNRRAMSLKKAVELAKRRLLVHRSTKIEIESFENGYDFLDMPYEGVTKNEIDEIVMVGRSTRAPKVRELLKDCFGKEPSGSINPDKAIVYGAAIQGAILSDGHYHFA